MRSLVFFVMFSSLILGVYSAIFFERQFPKYETDLKKIENMGIGHEGQCYDKEENVYYNQGEEMKWNSKECGRKLCTGGSRGDYSYVEIQTCGKVGKGPGCRFEVNLDLPYPNCCPRAVCPKLQNSGE